MDREGLAKEFFPEGNHRVLCLMTIGKPGEDAWYPRNPRLEYEEVVGTL
jgi:3-hydroxypropanoate dehydrogenase